MAKAQFRAQFRDPVSGYIKHIRELAKKHPRELEAAFFDYLSKREAVTRENMDAVGIFTSELTDGRAIVVPVSNTVLRVYINEEAARYLTDVMRAYSRSARTHVELKSERDVEDFIQALDKELRKRKNIARVFKAYAVLRAVLEAIKKAARGKPVISVTIYPSLGSAEIKAYKVNKEVVNELKKLLSEGRKGLKKESVKKELRQVLRGERPVEFEKVGLIFMQKLQSFVEAYNKLYEHYYPKFTRNPKDSVDVEEKVVKAIVKTLSARPLKLGLTEMPEEVEVKKEEKKSRKHHKKGKKEKNVEIDLGL